MNAPLNGLKPLALMKLALSPADETQVLAPSGPHFFAVKRLQILAEVCQETVPTCQRRPLRQLLELLSFELGNIATELLLEDDTTLIGGTN